MRTKEIELNGKKYLMTYSVQTEILAKERGLDLAKGFKKKSGEDADSYDLINIIDCMIKSGAQYADLAGLGKYDVTSVESLSILLGYDDIMAIMRDIAELVRGTRNVLADPPKGNSKNAEATQK